MINLKTNKKVPAYFKAGPISAVGVDRFAMAAANAYDIDHDAAYILYAYEVHHRRPARRDLPAVDILNRCAVQYRMPTNLRPVERETEASGVK